MKRLGLPLFKMKRSLSQCLIFLLQIIFFNNWWLFCEAGLRNQKCRLYFLYLYIAFLDLDKIACKSYSFKTNLCLCIFSKTRLVSPLTYTCLCSTPWALTLHPSEHTKTQCVPVCYHMGCGWAIDNIPDCRTVQEAFTLSTLGMDPTDEGAVHKQPP